MADNTPRLDLERFDQGDASWDHTDTVEAVDENAIVHGPIADRPTTGTYDDELYHATDQNITWRWDNTSSDWVHFSGLGSESQRVPGTSHLTDIDVNTLADTALSGQIDTTQLSDDAVTAAKIAAAAVQSEQIATDAVGSAEIATDAVSVDELAAALGTTSSNRVPGTTHFEESSHEALEAEQTSIGNATILRSSTGWETIEGTNPDDRLDNALSEASDGDVIYLENSEDYLKQRTGADALRRGTLIGTSSRFDGTRFTSDIETNASLDTMIIDAELTVVESALSFRNLSLAPDGDIIVGNDRCLLSHIIGRKTITFESGTENGEVGIVDGNLAITDNGNNRIL